MKQYILGAVVGERCPGLTLVGEIRVQGPMFFLAIRAPPIFVGKQALLIAGVCVAWDSPALGWTRP